MFEHPAGKNRPVESPAVCLEHGKAEPRAAIPYEIKPIDSVTDNPETQELCRMLGTGQINQRAAQVAVWHYNNSMSWHYLAGKATPVCRWHQPALFQPQEIRGGMNWAPWPPRWRSSGNSRSNSARFNTSTARHEISSLPALAFYRAFSWRLKAVGFCSHGYTPENFLPLRFRIFLLA